MDNWKQAYAYIKYELHQSQTALFGMIFFVGSISFLNALSLNSIDLYNKMDAMGSYDLAFVICFSLLPMWINMREFAAGQKGKNGTEAAPGVIFLLQLPVKRDIISKSRILSHIIRSYPVLITMLLIVYLLNAPVREEMPPLTYLVFCIIWLAFTLYGGGVLLSADFISSGMTVLSFILGVITSIACIAIVYSTFLFFTDVGIVYATVAAAKHYPLLSILGSAVLAAAGLHYIHNHNIKLMKKNDYL